MVGWGASDAVSHMLAITLIWGARTLQTLLNFIINYVYNVLIFDKVAAILYIPLTYIVRMAAHALVAMTCAIAYNVQISIIRSSNDVKILLIPFHIPTPIDHT